MYFKEFQKSTASGNIDHLQLVRIVRGERTGDGRITVAVSPFGCSVGCCRPVGPVLALWRGCYGALQPLRQAAIADIEYHNDKETKETMKL